MESKKKQLAGSFLYVIVNNAAILPKIKGSGIDVVQLRNKQYPGPELLEEAIKLRKILKKEKRLFIVNDCLDIAKITDSDGIHLGQGDTSLKTARKILGKDKIIGVSCHTLKQAKDAQAAGADYISIGPVFHTPTKPQYRAVGLSLIAKIKGKIKIPVFAIGGIDKNNAPEVLASGAKRIAVVRAVNQSKIIASIIRKTQ